MSRRVVALAASLLLLALTGCATPVGPGSAGPATPTATATATPAPTPTASPTLTATPSPTPTPDATVPADCESLVPIARVEEIFVPRLADEVIAADRASIDAVIREPEILDVALAADEHLLCAWGQPGTDNIVAAAAIQVDGETARRVIADLRAHDYEEVGSAGAVAYAKTFDDGDERLHPWSNVLHLFDGDVWIVAIDHFRTDSLAGRLAGAALDGARSASS